MNWLTLIGIFVLVIGIGIIWTQIALSLKTRKEKEVMMCETEVRKLLEDLKNTELTFKSEIDSIITEYDKYTTDQFEKGLPDRLAYIKKIKQKLEDIKDSSGQVMGAA